MSTVAIILATGIPATVPDTGASGLLLGLALISLGIAARFIKNRKR